MNWPQSLPVTPLGSGRTPWWRYRPTRGVNHMIYVCATPPDAAQFHTARTAQSIKTVNNPASEFECWGQTH